MSQWGPPEDDAFDFLDPSDPSSSAFPGAGGIGALPPEPEGDPVPSVGEPVSDSFDLAGAVSDPTGAVHVWFDDQHRVTNVRISNRWRERLKGGDLAAAILGVLGRWRFRRPPLPDTTSVGASGGSRLSSAGLDRMHERLAALNRRRALIDRDDPGAYDRIEGVEAEGLSNNRMVKVRLTVEGATAELTIEAEWVSDARADDLGTAVLQAHQQAYARYRPPTVIAGEFSQVAAEYRQIRADVAAMMQTGF